MKKYWFMTAIGLILFTFVLQTQGATLSVTTLSETAATITAASADVSNGDLVPNAAEDVMLYLSNTHSSSSATVTITAQNTSTTKTGYGNLTKSDATISLTAGQAKWGGPFPGKAFNNASDQLELSYTGDGAASVEVIPFKGTGLRAVR